MGFLFLAEFALDTIPAVQVALLGLAVAGLAGVVFRWRRLELWPLFVEGAILTPLIADSHVIGLPRCDAVRAGVACVAGSRDVVRQFEMDIAILIMALVAIVALIGREMLALRHMARDN